VVVEGVTYEVNWKAFKRGTSIFIPCLDPQKAKRQIREVLTRLKITVVTKVVIEEGIRGVRMWKT
tara:strand:- start:262 stop:456 length:195 start_codon:yes stop_codon:yes gene_type:complete